MLLRQEFLRNKDVEDEEKLVELKSKFEFLSPSRFSHSFLFVSAIRGLANYLLIQSGGQDERLRSKMEGLVAEMQKPNES